MQLETEAGTLVSLYNEHKGPHELNADISLNEFKEEVELKHEPLSDTDEEKPIQQLEGIQLKHQSVGEAEEADDIGEIEFVIEKMGKTNDKYQSPHCDVYFALQRSLRMHIDQKKCTKKQHSSLNCKKVFISFNKLQEHHDICRQARSNEEKFNEHNSEEHDHNPRNRCFTCKQVFGNISDVKNHVRIHTGEKPFTCSICSKGFTQNGLLKKHEVRHSNNKPFKCELCPKTFFTKEEVKKHSRVHSGVRPYVCDICGTSFTIWGTMVNHKRIHTGERPYGCELCPKAFITRERLKCHRLSHTGERPYECKFCIKRFTQKCDCTIHMHIYTSERKHTCHICFSKFRQSGTLKAHIRTHEKRLEKCKLEAAVKINS